MLVENRPAPTSQQEEESPERGGSPEREQTSAEVMEQLVRDFRVNSHKELARRTEAFRPRNPEEERKAAIYSSVSGLVLSSGMGLALAGTGAWVPVLAGAAASAAGSWAFRRLHATGKGYRRVKQEIADAGDVIIAKEEAIWAELEDKDAKVQELEAAGTPEAKQEATRLKIEIVENLIAMSDARSKKPREEGEISETAKRWQEIEDLKQYFRKKGKGLFRKKLGWSILGGIVVGGAVSIGLNLLGEIKAQLLSQLNEAPGKGLGSIVSKIPGLGGREHEILQHGGQLVFRYTGAEKQILETITSPDTAQAIAEATRSGATEFTSGKLAGMPVKAVEFIFNGLNSPLLSDGMHQMADEVTRQFDQTVLIKFLGVVLGLFGLSGAVSTLGRRDKYSGESQFAKDISKYKTVLERRTGESRGSTEGSTESGSDGDSGERSKKIEVGRRQLWMRKLPLAEFSGAEIPVTIEIKNVGSDGSLTATVLSPPNANLGDNLPQSVDDLKATWRYLPGSGHFTIPRMPAGTEIVSADGEDEFIDAFNNSIPIGDGEVDQILVVERNGHRYRVAEIQPKEGDGGHWYRETHLIEVDDSYDDTEASDRVPLEVIARGAESGAWSYEPVDVTPEMRRHWQEQEELQRRRVEQEREADLERRASQIDGYRGRIFDDDPLGRQDRRREFFQALVDVVGGHNGKVTVMVPRGNVLDCYEIGSEINPTLTPTTPENEIKTVNARKLASDQESEELVPTDEVKPFELGELFNAERNWFFAVQETDSKERQAAAEWADKNDYRVQGRLDRENTNFLRALYFARYGRLKIIIRNKRGELVEISSAQRKKLSFSRKNLTKTEYRIVAKTVGREDRREMDKFSYAEAGVEDIDYWLTDKREDTQFQLDAQLREKGFTEGNFLTNSRKDFIDACNDRGKIIVITYTDGRLYKVSPVSAPNIKLQAVGIEDPESGTEASFDVPVADLFYPPYCQFWYSRPVGPGVSPLPPADTPDLAPPATPSAGEPGPVSSPFVSKPDPAPTSTPTVSPGAPSPSLAPPMPGSAPELATAETLELARGFEKGKIYYPQHEETVATVYEAGRGAGNKATLILDPSDTLEMISVSPTGHQVVFRLKRVTPLGEKTYNVYLETDRANKLLAATPVTVAVPPLPSYGVEAPEPTVHEQAFKFIREKYDRRELFAASFSENRSDDGSLWGYELRPEDMGAVVVYVSKEDVRDESGNQVSPNLSQRERVRVAWGNRSADGAAHAGIVIIRPELPAAESEPGVIKRGFSKIRDTAEAGLHGLIDTIKGVEVQAEIIQEGSEIGIKVNFNNQELRLLLSPDSVRLVGDVKVGDKVNVKLERIFRSDPSDANCPLEVKLMEDAPAVPEKPLPDFVVSEPVSAPETVVLPAPEQVETAGKPVSVEEANTDALDALTELRRRLGKE